jgi:hypothetical protein
MKTVFLLFLIFILQIASARASDNPPLQEIYLSPTGEYSVFIQEYTLLIYNVSSHKLLFRRDLIPAPHIAIDRELNPLAIQGDFISMSGLIGLWSPDGSRFAWTESTPGTGSGENYDNGDGRVGIFSVKDEAVTLLPDERGMPFDLSWSPDSQYLIYQGIIHYGTGAGPTVSGAYLVTPHNQWQEIKLLDLSMKAVPYIIFHGWLLDHTLLYSEWSIPTLLSYDPSTNSITDFLPYEPDYYLYELVSWFDPTYGYVVFTVSAPPNSQESLFEYLFDALYLIDLNEPEEPRLVYQKDSTIGRNIISQLQFLDAETIYIHENYYNTENERIGSKRSLVNITNGISTTIHASPSTVTGS